MNVSKEYKNALLELFDSLPYGSLTRISEELGITKQTVHDVKNCKFKNERVLELAKEMVLKANADKSRKEQELVEFVNEHVRKKVA